MFYSQLGCKAPPTGAVENATHFLSQGKMAVYLGGLPGAALAMYHCANNKMRPEIKALLISGVVACVVGGITEPLEFLFLFIAPWLYLIHAVLVGLGFLVAAVLGILKTPGREEPSAEEAVEDEAPKGELVAGKYDPVAILAAIGGHANITSLDNCITRLRMTVEDAELVDEARLKKLGAVGVVKLDAHNVQVIIGPQVQSVKDAIAGLSTVGGAR